MRITTIRTAIGGDIDGTGGPWSTSSSPEPGRQV
ncbi:hypothetical protein Ae263Ps1_5551c [Pseudonocardia sp. Ae263_Ps1]|nr:hypothetical protein Ae150APs1_5770 [Pseudonocardia sp. Ae150A_Ps1]OLL88496.1 hypothetical protein Ae263Ps1_5551c [Pseudonocardia sp. Ae263_Ps1]OLL91481.1 hypothetical protein Ae356Ps1_1378 [Pseudonocardia sp. Ae356_Ps1]